MTDPHAAAQRLRAYLAARPGAASLGGSVEYGPEFTSANGRPAGFYALDRADLEAVLSERDRLQQEVQRQIDAKMGVAGEWGNALAEKAVAEQATARVRAKAAEWAELAPADDLGMTPTDTVLADAGRYLLALIDQPERIPK